MDVAMIKSLINEFKDSDLTKIKLKNDAFEIELERTVTVSAPMVAPMQMPVAAQQVASTQININEPVAEVKAAGHAIKSPMVGTFYRSSGPGAKPFVEVGTKVKKGDTVCIIEAMKLMNEVEADRDGEIVEILVENEAMVEFDQPMFTIR